VKQRALTRSLAFWLHQGASFVLLHSAYEGAHDEMSHALIPELREPKAFRWQDAPPLAALRALCDGLKDARPVETTAPLRFRYALRPDPVLIPATGRTGPLRASDLVALLPFQLDAKRFAVAAYVVSPNIAERLRPMRMTLQLDRRVTDAGVALAQPAVGMTGSALVTGRTADATTVALDLGDDVTWLRFEVE
jgi:hypothetical protein